MAITIIKTHRSNTFGKNTLESILKAVQEKKEKEIIEVKTTYEFKNFESLKNIVEKIKDNTLDLYEKKIKRFFIENFDTLKDTNETIIIPEILKIKNKYFYKKILSEIIEKKDYGQDLEYHEKIILQHSIDFKDKNKRNKKRIKKEYKEILDIIKIIKCSSKQHNEYIINEYISDKNKKYKVLYKYKCSNSNCFFCKRNKVLSNLKNKLIHHYEKENGKFFDVYDKIHFLTISTPFDMNDNIKKFGFEIANDNLKLEIAKLKENIKNYFDNKKIKFIASFEVAAKLHTHIIFYDLQFYSLLKITSELKAITKNYVNITNFKYKNNGTDDKIKEYIAKIQEYISKIQSNKNNSKHYNQNFLKMKSKDFQAMLLLKDFNTEIIDNYINKLDIDKVEFIESALLNISNVFRKVNEVKNINFAFSFLFSQLFFKYNFSIEMIKQRLLKKENSENTRQIKKYNYILDKFTTVNEKLKTDKEINKNVNDKAKIIKYNLLKYTLEKTKKYIEYIKLFFDKYYIKVETIENQVYFNTDLKDYKKVYSSIFVSAIIKRMLLTNIRIIKQEKNLHFENKDFSELENLKFNSVKKIKPKEPLNFDKISSGDKIYIEKLNTLTEKFNKKANDISVLSNKFVKNSIEIKNNMITEKDFQNENYKMMLLKYVENQTNKHTAINKKKENYLLIRDTYKNNLIEKIEKRIKKLYKIDFKLNSK